MNRRAKIVCTIGPASRDEATLEGLMEAGMNVARLNFSHGSHEDHRQTCDRLRKLADRRGHPLAILADLQGPKIRVGKFADGAVDLVPGQTFRLWRDPSRLGTSEGVGLTWPSLIDEVGPGEPLLLDDGLLLLEVIETREDELLTVVRVGGRLSNNKGVNVPGAALSIPALTDKDKADLAFIAELGVDLIALSFVRSALDVHHLRHLLPPGPDAPHIIAKIEKPQAIDHLADIVAAADGIMLARGDLGVEMPAERVPILQKQAIDLTNAAGKPTIIATQMLESMTQNPRPTRAEASDVATAVFDGADAVMLSGETASGRYPIEAVRIMSRIIEEAEASRYALRSPRTDRPPLGRLMFPMAIAKSAAVAAEELAVEVIACFTVSGRSARLIMAHRPRRPIVAFTPSRRTFARMALYWGVSPRMAELRTDTDDLILGVEEALRAEAFAQDGDHILIVMGIPVGSNMPTNMIKFHALGFRPDDRS